MLMLLSGVGEPMRLGMSARGCCRHRGGGGDSAHAWRRCCFVEMSKGGNFGQHAGSEKGEQYKDFGLCRDEWR